MIERCGKLTYVRGRTTWGSVKLSSVKAEKIGTYPERFETLTEAHKHVEDILKRFDADFVVGDVVEYMFEKRTCRGIVYKDRDDSRLSVITDCHCQGNYVQRYIDNIGYSAMRKINHVTYVSTDADNMRYFASDYF